MPDEQSPIASERNKLIDGLINQGAYKQALDAINSTPEGQLNKDERFYRALCYIALKEQEKAKNDLFKLLQDEKVNPYVYFTLGELFEITNENDRAVYFYTKATKFKETIEDAKRKLHELNPLVEVNEENARLVDLKPFRSNLTFKDVQGLQGVKDILFSNIVLPIKEPELFKKHGRKRGGGLILFGASGTGKTFLSRAIAGEAGCYMLIARPQQIKGEFVGSSERNLSFLFQVAHVHEPCIIFFDEIDGFAEKRGNLGGSDEHGGSQVEKNLVNQFLIELDGIDKNQEGVFVIGATNIPWTIDPALKRKGRMGESIYVPPPTTKEREMTLRYHMRNKVATNIDFGRISRATVGYSQADLEAVCEDASLAIILKEYKTKKMQKITTEDMLKVVGKSKGTLEQWYQYARKQIIGSFKFQVVDGKEHSSWESSNLEPDEMKNYEPMIKDIMKNTDSVEIFKKRFMRFVAMYLF